AVAVLVGVGALLWGLRLHEDYALKNSYQHLASFTLGERPLDELMRLSDRMAELADETLYVVTRPEYTQPRFVALLAALSPRSRVAGRWTNCPYLEGPDFAPVYAEPTDRLPQPEPVTLISYRPHVPIPGARYLAAGVSAIPVGDGPLLVQVGGD